MSACVRLKDGVVLAPLTPALIRLLAVIDQGARLLGRDLTVTCGREAHPPSDPHTLGAAIDLRAKDLPDGPAMALLQFLRAQLGAEFTVLYETPTKLTSALAPYAYVNPSATAVHVHMQVRKGFGPWPSA